LNVSIAAAFALAGGIGGLLIHRAIEKRDPRRSAIERTIAVAASSIIPALLYVKYEAAAEVAAVYGILALVLIGTSVFDLRKQVIPHFVTLPGIAAGLAASTWILPVGFRSAVIGMLLGAGILLFTTFVEAVRGKEVGGGDWKLAAAIGSFLGTNRLVTAMLFAGLFGMIVGVILVLRRSTSKPAALGPYLSAGAIAAMFWR
jgi:prepilin signal peptidase PulO-like enzyme (type II secretory pathway)